MTIGTMEPSTRGPDMTLNFHCTQCGECCRRFKLSLSVAEARAWLADGNPVQVLCEAIPWPMEPPAEDPVAAYKRTRSFAAASGVLPIRVLVTLVASLDKGCPNLTADNRCAIYERRPAVCRIYPAERNPFLELAPARRVCPTDAWDASGPAFAADGGYADPAVVESIRSAAAADVRDAALKERLCAALGIGAAAMANEGYVMHAPDRERLREALEGTTAPCGPVAWRFVSERPATVEALRLVGAVAERADDVPFRYLSLFPLQDKAA